MHQELIDAIVNMKEEEATLIAGKLLDGGEDALSVLADCKDAMAAVALAKGWVRGA